jgi:uncharacterized protein with NRDE domain
MCLLLLAFRVVPQHDWLLLGNRDEYHARATAPAQAWADDPQILGGRDLEAGGSWLAVRHNGRFAAVTNVRDGAARRGPRSRGDLVAAFVRGTVSPEKYVAAVATARAEYGPFNLIVGDRSVAAAASSLRAQAWPLAAGIHVFSNGPPETPWPKTRRLEALFGTLLQRGRVAVGTREQDADTPFDARLLDLLSDIDQPHDAELPQTGVGLQLERTLAPIFIRGTHYGTRASTLAYARDDRSITLVERRDGPDGVAQGETRVG